MTISHSAFGLLGEQLSHSYSKIIHEHFGYEYNLFEVPLHELANFMLKREFSGLNVTIPYKQKVLPFCDVVDDIACKIGAANTLYFDNAGRLHATNTDYFGFIDALNFCDVDLSNKIVTVFGFGGAARAIILAAVSLHAKKLYIVSRSTAQPPDIQADIECIDFQSMNTAYESDMIINATPLGMFPNTKASPCDLSLFPNCKFVFDAVYNPIKTALLEQACMLNIKNSSGLYMLAAQAAKSAEFFTGKHFDSSETVQNIYRILKNRL